MHAHAHIHTHTITSQTIEFSTSLEQENGTELTCVTHTMDIQGRYASSWLGLLWDTHLGTGHQIMNCSPAHILKDISTQQRIWTTRPDVHSPSRWFQTLSSSLLARSYITWSRASHPTVPWLVSWSTKTTKQKLMAAILRYYTFEVTRGNRSTR